MKLFYKKANDFFMQFRKTSLQKTGIKNSCESSWHLTTATLPLFIYFFSIFVLYVDNLSQNIYLGKNHSSSQVQFQFHIPAWVDNCGFVTVLFCMLISCLAYNCSDFHIISVEYFGNLIARWKVFFLLSLENNVLNLEIYSNYKTD